MKRDFNKWLASLGPAAPVKTLTELRAWNTAHERKGTLKYGQSRLDASDKVDLEKDRPKYEEDRARDIRLGATTGIDAALKAHSLDALLFAGASSAGIASKPGYPTVLVPFGMIPNPPGTHGPAAGPDRGDAPPAAPGTAPAGTAPSATRTAKGRGGASAEPFPPGFDAKPQPYGIGFTGTACSEPTLLRLAYAFEQATKKRTAPPGLR
jgi:amidase